MPVVFSDINSDCAEICSVTEYAFPPGHFVFDRLGGQCRGRQETSVRLLPRSSLDAGNGVGVWRLGTTKDRCDVHFAALLLSILDGLNKNLAHPNIVMARPRRRYGELRLRSNRKIVLLDLVNST